MRRRRWWHAYVPDHLSDPFGLAWKLLTSDNPAARSAVLMAFAGVALTPLDILFQAAERRAYAKAPRPARPVLLVCGPPRSGTTLLAQYLINSFQVCYLNNLTSLFPRSPVTANRWSGRLARPRRGGYAAYYGKSPGLSGANDALYIWDRWLGSDRGSVPQKLVPGSEHSMAAFFGALEALYRLPVVNKVNRLNTCASLVAEQLENSCFICLHRDPLMLAQSLYLARREIRGDVSKAYGVHASNDDAADPVEDVCRQVLFHESHARRQQELLGDRRFSIVSYEEFCRRPANFAASIARDCSGLEFRDPGGGDDAAFRISSGERLPAKLLDRMRGRLAELGAGDLNCRVF
jgi:hypothetical protein